MHYTACNWHMLKICTTAQSKLETPSNDIDVNKKIKAKKTLIVIVDCYLMNSNWIFSKRDPYNSSSSPWPANVIAPTASHNPASNVLVIRPHSISWKLVRTAERANCLTSPTANYNKGANIRQGLTPHPAIGALPMHICD